MIQKPKVLTDEELEKAEDKCWKIWEKVRGDLAPIRRELVAEAQCDDTYAKTLKAVVEWGNSFCVTVEHYGSDKRANTRKRECYKCWQTLQNEVSNGD